MTRTCWRRKTNYTTKVKSEKEAAGTLGIRQNGGQSMVGAMAGIDNWMG